MTRVPNVLRDSWLHPLVDLSYMCCGKDVVASGPKRQFWKLLASYNGLFPFPVIVANEGL